MGRRICVQVLVGNSSEMSAFQWARLAANATRPWSIIGRVGLRVEDLGFKRFSLGF